MGEKERRSPYKKRDSLIKQLRKDSDEWRDKYWKEESERSRLFTLKINAETSLDGFKKLSASLTAEYEGYRKAMGEVLDRLLPKKE
jgi:hypothetical protein